ncbi:MAG TPA: histidine kinase [Candidatus Acidoferrales bacterium]|nr:histidine kinase [Candidatus Acidoferrales bacterium]
MHPILSSLRRFILYLIAWIPLAALLAYLMAATAALTWRQAVAMSFPLCLLFSFVCLSAWYSCRATPFDTSSIAKLIRVHLLGALVAGFLWILAAELLARALSETRSFAPLAARLPRVFLLLFGTGVLFYLLSVNFYYVLLAVEASKEAEARVMQASVLARDAELRALKAQVNPHFLFNSLNSISALTSSDPARAREMCILLGDFLRRTLGLGEKLSIPLEEEMSLTHAFLAVEKIRFGARLHMEESVDTAALPFHVPPLLLQPLVENAVAHGVANLVEGGWIRLHVKLEGSALQIAVENLFDPEAPARRRNGVGLANVRQRLEARYPTRSVFSAKAEGDRFRVALSLPAEKEAPSA